MLRLAVTKLVAYDALGSLLEQLIVGNLVYRDYEPCFANQGDTVN